MKICLKSYVDALYCCTDAPLVIGLTGFTGVGCSTTRNLLTREEKPALPGYEAATNHESRETVTNMDKRVHEKLVHHWNYLDWVPFVPIEVSKVIFLYFLDAYLNDRKIPDLELNGEIEATIRDFSPKLERHCYLSDDAVRYDSEKARQLVDAYEISKLIYQRYKASVEKARLGRFIEMLQDFGDTIRRYGVIGSDSSEPRARNCFELPKAVARVISAYRCSLNSRRFIIDTLKNPYEIEYFRERYSRFYLVGVLRDAATTRNSMLERLDLPSVEAIEARERADRTKDSAVDLLNHVTSQDIEECLKKSDVFIHNRESASGTCEHLRFNIIKLITLCERRGCLTPTQDERCMQLAMTARLASGCISRQVGAIVIDEERRVVGVGWNDTPKGQIPCALRTCDELLNNPTDDVFSNYERSPKFLNHIADQKMGNVPFCFRTEKGIMEKKKQQEYTRALHAEENSLFQALRNCGNSLLGATLYTTARTCTLCAKKAYQLGIKRIVYIDEYYDDAIEQTLKVGKRQISIQRFSGVIGEAYSRLYLAPMPEKNQIKLGLVTIDEWPTV